MAVPNWPVEWGGKDWTPLQRQIWLDELQLAGIPEPLAFNAKMVGPVIAQFGSQELKQRFLPPTANIDIWWCQGFSEPEAGSDLASLRTTAVRDGDTYVVNGQKTWTTLGQYADWIFLLARTDPERAQASSRHLLPAGEMDTPGITLRPIKLIDGGYEVNEVFFEDVRVPADQLVGEENQGWTYAKFLLGNERTGIARIGTTKLWMAQVKERAAQMRLNGIARCSTTPCSRRGSPRSRTGCWHWNSRRCGSADRRPTASRTPRRRSSSCAAASCSKRPPNCSSRWPDRTHCRSAPVATSTRRCGRSMPHPNYLNYRKTSIYGGTNEIQRTIIASTILGL